MILTILLEWQEKYRHSDNTTWRDGDLLPSMAKSPA